MPDEQPYQDPDQTHQGPDQTHQPYRDHQPDQIHQPYQSPQPETNQRPDRGRSRQPDPVSIGSGLVFFLIGGAYLLASGGHLTVNAGWTLSLLALGLGLSGIVGAILRSRRSDDRHD